MDINQAILNEIKDEWIDTDKLCRDNFTYTYNGIKVPRVTVILKSIAINNESLLKWANSLGYKHTSYVKERNIAASKGTAIHKAVEDYIKYNKEPEITEILDDNTKSQILNAFFGFKSFWDCYKKTHSIDSIKLEQSISTPYYGGTYDMLVKETNGIETLFDFKSSNSFHWEHYMQLAAYKYALDFFDKDKHNIQKISILLLNKNEPRCNEYIIDFSIDYNKIFFDNCIKGFMSILYAFYNLIQLEQDYKNLIHEERR